MTSVSDWTMAFCLTCDGQTTDGPYCSQACRIADVERSQGQDYYQHQQYQQYQQYQSSGYGAHTSHPPSSSASSNSSPTQTSGLYLPPTVNSSAYQTFTSSSSPEYSQHYYGYAAQGNYTLTNEPASARDYGYSDSDPDLNLGYYSSRESSRSNSYGYSSHYTNHAPAVSEHTRQQLQSYESSFDKVRHRRYRY